jgi:hypothetical protein
VKVRRSGAQPGELYGGIPYPMSDSDPGPRITAARRGVLVVAIFVAGLLVGFLLRPEPPKFQPAERSSASESDHRPGGHKCEPDQTSRNTSPVEKQRRTDECAAERAAYDQREQDRTEETRTAVATEQAAQQAYNQAVGGAAAAGIFVWALGASIWAGIAAARAAGAADRTLKHQQWSTERELRAYVFVHETRLSLTPKFRISGSTGNRILLVRRTTDTVRFTYENTGRTPAKNVQVAAKALYIPTENGPNVDVRDPGSFRLIGPLGPESVFTEDVKIANCPPNPVDIEAGLRSGRYEVHLWGRITYDTEFQKERFTSFHCFTGGRVRYERTLHNTEPGNAYN